MAHDMCRINKAGAVTVQLMRTPAKRAPYKSHHARPMGNHYSRNPRKEQDTAREQPLKQ